MGKRKTHEVEDQYGEYRSQDRDTNFQPSRGGHSGGGSAGGSRRGGDLSFQRHVPKFLQPYAHMLGGRKQAEEEPIVVNEPDSDKDDDGDAEAIQRALEDNPELAKELGDKYVKRIQASKEKDAGNAAFSSQNYDTAVQHFSKCVELDPTDAVHYSNRSAAYANLAKYDEALADAQKVIAMKPNWVKGHARLAAALCGLKHYGDAKEAYERALKYEPDDQALQKGYDKALGMEMQHMRDKKHVFKKATPGSEKVSRHEQALGAAAAAAAGKRGSGVKVAAAAAAAGTKPKGLLSFAEAGEEQ
eukprot:jgi/Chrzof1/9643/Cz04g10220.t1